MGSNVLGFFFLNHFMMLTFASLAVLITLEAESWETGIRAHSGDSPQKVPNAQG
jgi:hypothetical protein